ncbi:hypothetical protein L1987_79793 [Smallanthus sonchifolius]|uniref:Uncharacterized protein n=1 Tax=Smallanthus sonchifolius TaxID=185202 RepID=A0ACB8YKX8_9ASTR|nr:hypothetical protein L1987_79793 [Smallanthus sonchifolius]
MIPCDDHPPPDLSPSDHFNQQKSHDFKISCDENFHASVSDIDLVADLDASNNPQSSFSIRDFAFNLRSKNIARNWPFSRKTLQICLQHEVKNILPPFQSLESLRNNSSNQEIISSCNGKSNLELILESRNSKNLGQTKSKKPVLGSSRKTETETVMASKICPVCKIFSSSSNTTLNAHIDQCLSGESTMNWTANPEVVIKHRIKPRKMRLMVDIYKTAPHCTVEELDARNGTSWANNSSFPDQEIEFHREEEKEERAATTVVDHEGAVYSDTNRTEVQILPVPKVDNDTSNDGSQKRGKSGKVFLRKKKNKKHEREHDHVQNYLKQSRKLFTCIKKSSFEVAAGPEETVGSGESCNKEVMNKVDFPIVRPPWACSKRTGLAKKNFTVARVESFSKSGFKPSSSSSKLSQENSQKTGSLTPNKVHFAKKRSLLLTKPSSQHLKKCVDPSDSFLVKGSDVRSKGSKNLLSLSRKTVSKTNLKRKFSALKRSKDSLKQESGGKEDTSGKTSCESMNPLEVKKDEKMEICRRENSVSSRSLNEDSSWLNIESVRNETRSIKEQVSTIEIPKSSNNLLDSRERAIDVTDDIERQQHYHDMSDSPISTVSNPSLARSDSDKFPIRSTPRNDDKYALVNLTSSGDWKSKGQSQTTSFKNDHQPCCSRKEIASSQTLLRKHDVESFNFRPQMFSVSNFPTSLPPPPPPVKLPPYPECNYVASPKPVIRLMGKNLTVINTDEDKVDCNQFPNVENRYSFSLNPPNSLKNHAFDTMFQSTMIPHVGPMIPANHNRKNSMAFNNGSFQACSPFMQVETNNNLAKWNCKPAGSSRSSAIYYPSSFS